MLFGADWQVRLGPLRTAAGTVELRPIRARDARQWSRLRLLNRAELQPWEPSGEVDWTRRHAASAWPPLCSSLRSQARSGTLVPLVIEVNGEYGGQITIGNITRGQLQSAWVGYWVDRRFTGRGVATTAVALAADHCFHRLGLHRVEATVRPENAGSRAVLSNSGFREEGVLRRYLHVDGAWRDHLLMGLTAEEIPDSMVARVVRSGRAWF
ncbi:[ribosomal protein S5]-alanine N-acetyltransferase OS=Tsukamurella paurometabola (strain ATCC 8368/ DSM / CCUG 35730 / CIP 100753 / JCM 10117 / KCTC 9821/ NBRC 16120 / NCIMB 702349 / NCTC 13040) OX=521096 GN=Tpau_3266 PE=3 SV=1 [Tsukamurella paurometabola]|uniref:GCN5-related N-acetyltransferase n=1 Tax=Tsukamurella paurometabola (strain ATCC 8368 / DSM 20162 / CCUG 35730 / CIP 100753 / JCM 10117 / KCTC 9821 / NBRC 16120 / NCIMB 702349 / NCTC 13040) TaxID=521096 RepID=D5UVR9_TSUPD|nr:GNAT family protein [Tsukamurella paurometabola]ADG79851.1 GCN5-related N-acetyltransferase [Tsukamurella paurometabola DSM 20162]SUP37424.1 Putative ribosomal N-acetyltransferase YdaF [Tsukamurella paurometabola]